MASMSAIDLGPRYTYLRGLGRGGMGRVLQARDACLTQDRALKPLHDRPDTRAELEQAQREFALLAKIDHPGIARAYDFGYLGERPYFTSEFIPGEPLSARGVIEDLSELLE